MRLLSKGIQKTRQFTGMDQMEDLNSYDAGKKIYYLENDKIVLVDNKNSELYKYEDDLDSDKEN